MQEDVDVVALSILSGAHMTLFPDVLELMQQRGIGDRLLTGGGIIPAEDMESLTRARRRQTVRAGLLDAGHRALHSRVVRRSAYGADALAPAAAPRAGCARGGQPERAAPARATPACRGEAGAPAGREGGARSERARSPAAKRAAQTRRRQAHRAAPRARKRARDARSVAR